VTDVAASALADALRDRYVLERELGRGGMATVYLAHDLKHDRKVALKVLHPELAATLGPERFLREIHTTARLQHPHILPVLDSGEDARQLWYTMPFVMGESLRDRLRREVQLPIETAIELAKQVALALDYAHREGVIHRDLKPENILLADGQALVADFGVAKAVNTAGEGQLTETGMTLGTPMYMSPEQASADRHLDQRTDLYALGCVLYEMLAGQPPFVGVTARAIIARHVLDPVPSLRSVRPTVPEFIEAAIIRALAKVPADRFATALELSEALTTGAEVTQWKETPRSYKRSLFSLRVAGMIGVTALVLFVWHGDSLFRRRAQPGPRVLVVLPFRNLGSPTDQYFADGLTEELTTRLAGLPGLQVIAPTTAALYGPQPPSLRKLGKELGAGYVLQGSVRWERDRTPGSPGRLRVTSQLIQLPDENHRWAKVYEADLTEVFGVQSRIAEEVVQSLNLALGAPAQAALTQGGTHQPEAYDFYLRGNEYLGRSNGETDLRSAVSLYRQAVALDPAFAEAQARLSRAHVQIYWHYFDHTEARLRLAKAAADAGRARAPDLPETQVARGDYHNRGELN
jgi:TolB-like protein/tRNA A-37 threonylcarbamoyl transferase component Bud32